MSSVSWMDLNTTSGVRKVSVPQKGKGWRVYDSVLTLAESDQGSQRTLF